MFVGRNDPGSYYLDDVSVNLSVPEPSTYAIGAVVLAWIFAFHRSRRRLVACRVKP